MIPILITAAALALAPQDSTRLTLGDAVDRALGAHPSVAAARATADAASAEIGQARAAWLPAVSLDGAVSKFQKPMVVYPLHALDLRNPPLFDTELSQASIGAAYTLFDFGARRAKVRAAESQREAAGAVLSATEQQLATRTIGAFLRVLTARGVLAADDQRVAALSAEAKRARDRFAAGKSARVDTLRAASELTGAIADRVNSAATVEMAEHDLARLIGAAPGSLRNASLAPVRLVSVRAAKATAAAQAADARTSGNPQGNADVMAAARRADAATASVGSAKAARLPQFNATTALVDRSNITGRWQSEWQVGVGVSWPVFTGGARESAIARAQATARAAQEQLRLARLNADQQVDEAQAAFAAASARAAALDAAVQQAAEVARITALARDVGEGTQTEYLLAESLLYRVRSSLVQARHAMIGARVELARAQGELTRHWMTISLEPQP
ncbi:MAG: TolC family protein [Gemmatimonadota bacterium]|nr:TolC family protein [Gemmatimonadota bacterium]